MDEVLGILLGLDHACESMRGRSPAGSRFGLGIAAAAAMEPGRRRLWPTLRTSHGVRPPLRQAATVRGSCAWPPRLWTSLSTTHGRPDVQRLPLKQRLL